MKITNESLYTQTLEKMRALLSEINATRREFHKLEGDMFDYQSTRVYSENRNIGNMSNLIQIAGQEYEELKSTYGGKK